MKIIQVLNRQGLGWFSLLPSIQRKNLISADLQKCVTYIVPLFVCFFCGTNNCLNDFRLFFIGVSF